MAKATAKAKATAWEQPQTITKYFVYPLSLVNRTERAS